MGGSLVGGGLSDAVPMIPKRVSMQHKPIVIQRYLQRASPLQVMDSHTPRTAEGAERGHTEKVQIRALRQQCDHDPVYSTL